MISYNRLPPWTILSQWISITIGLLSDRGLAEWIAIQHRQAVENY